MSEPNSLRLNGVADDLALTELLVALKLVTMTLIVFLQPSRNGAGMVGALRVIRRTSFTVRSNVR